MDLILHIGTEKTGTTSLQSWFAANRETLSALGILYPVSLGRVRSVHMSMITAEFRHSDTIALRSYNISDEDGLRHFSEAVGRALESELKAGEARGLHTCVVSDEGLQAVLRTEEEVRRVKSLVNRYFNNIKIVVQLRPQVDYCISFASTIARHGFRIDSRWFENVGPQNFRYNYNQLILRWERVFGAEAVQIIPYKRYPQTIASFCDLLSLEQDKFKAVARENAFVDWRFIHILNSISYTERTRLLRLASTLPSLERLQIGADLATEITKRFAQGNGFLTGRRKDVLPDDLNPDMNSFAENPNLTALDSDLVVGPILEAIFEKLGN